MKNRLQFLETNAGLILVALVCMFLLIASTIVVALLLPKEERLFLMLSQMAVGFHGSLLTVLQWKRLESKAERGAKAQLPIDESTAQPSS